MKFEGLFSTFVLLEGLTLTGCNSMNGSPALSSGTSAQNILANIGGGIPISPTPPIPLPRKYLTDVLLFTGDGTWTAEISSLENILSTNKSTFQEFSSA